MLPHRLLGITVRWTRLAAAATVFTADARHAASGDGNKVSGHPYPGTAHAGEQSARGPLALRPLRQVLRAFQ